MAISQFTEPDVDLFFDDLTQVIRLDNKAAFYGKGYINAGLSNMDNTNIPVLSQGSMFECGCVLFIGGSNTGIPGTHSGGLNYIYFNPSDKSLSYSTDRPEWNAVKGGWYKGNNRALALLYFYKGEYRGKRVIGGVQDDLMPGDTGYIDEGGTSVSIPGYIDNAKNIYQFYLPPGAYRYILVSGTGGGDAFQQNGGIPNQGSSVLGMFIWNGGTIRIMTGGDGFKGGNGGGLHGKGGGSGAGEASEIVGIAKTYPVRAGRSGIFNGSGDNGNMNNEGYGGNSISGEGSVGQGGGYGYGGGGDGSGGGGGSGGPGSESGGNSNYASDGSNGGGAGGAPGWQRNYSSPGLPGEPGGRCFLLRLW